MASLFSKSWAWASSYTEINGATLTGAIDVVVIEQEDSTLIGSPFHVRFGKLGVLYGREKVVEMQVNGNDSPLRMKIGETGEAFFVEDVSEGDMVGGLPEYYATSPISSFILGEDYRKIKDDHDEMTNFACNDKIRKTSANKKTQEKPLPAHKCASDFSPAWSADNGDNPKIADEFGFHFIQLISLLI